MKTILQTSYRIFLGIILFTLAGCGTSSDETSEQERKDSLFGDAPNAIVDDINSNQSEILDLALGETEDGVVRGIAIGDDLSKVKLTEKFTVFEETPGSVGYSYDTDHLETIDVVYYYANNSKVTRIGIDIYLNSKASMENLWVISGRRMTKIYPETNLISENSVEFKGKSGKVIIEKIESEMDFGLKYSFEPASGNIALSNR
jgi:hypothetical protein